MSATTSVHVPSITMSSLLQTPDPTSQGKVQRKQVKSIMRRPPNAWTIFLNGNRVRVQRPLKGQQPIDPAEVKSGAEVKISGKGEVKRLASVWKDMSDDQKKPYKDQSTTRRQENKVRFRGLPESDKAIVKRFKTENPRAQSQPSPYMSYVKAEGGVIIKKHGIKEGGKLLGKNWKDMTPEQKRSFVTNSSATLPISTVSSVPSAPVPINETGNAEADNDDESEYSSDLEEGEIAQGSQA